MAENGEYTQTFALNSIRVLTLVHAIILVMAIHMGIMCDACGTVHSIARAPGIELSPSIEGMYKLTCKPACSRARHLRKDEMRPYRVSDDIFNAGHADVGEYELVEGGCITGRALLILSTCSFWG